MKFHRKEIIGKRLMYFKVCSCPKRDKTKEEQQFWEQQNGGSGVQYKRRADEREFLSLVTRFLKKKFNFFFVSNSTSIDKWQTSVHHSS